MNRNLLLVALSLFTWGVGEGLFIYFQPIYLQQWGADPLMIGAVFGEWGLPWLIPDSSWHIFPTVTVPAR